MFRIIKRCFPTPWHLILAFMPLPLVVAGIVFGRTLFVHVYPGWSAQLMTIAAGLEPSKSLSFPLFNLFVKALAPLTYGDLPLRLNLFSAVCGTLATGLFYLFTARTIFLFACEDPGGAMLALPQGDKGMETFMLPEAVQEHNWLVGVAAALGGVGAASALAFSAPYWIASTRLYPHTFDLMLFFMIANLLMAYHQHGRLWTLLLGVLMLTACLTESAIFIVLGVVSGILTVRALLLNEDMRVSKVMLVGLCGLAGVSLSTIVLWLSAANCSLITYMSPRLITNMYLDGVLGEVLSWVPRFGWSCSFLQLLLPCALSLYVFSHSFHQRTWLNLFLQILLIATLLPSLLNLPYSPWGLARLTTRLPVFSSVFMALFVGMMIAVWFLMIEIFSESAEVELDFYEYRDSPLVCKIGFSLCWPLLLLSLAMPYRSFVNVDPREGAFADQLADVLYKNLGQRDWLVNTDLLRDHLLLRASRDGRRLHFIATEHQENAALSRELSDVIHNEADFEGRRSRLINAAELSPSVFLQEWLRGETNVCGRVALFDSATEWRDSGFHAIPLGFFLRGLPVDQEYDLAGVSKAQQEFAEALEPLLFPVVRDRLALFGRIRRAARSQLALMHNELAVLLYSNGERDEAYEWLKRADRLDSGNMVIMMNLYALVVGDENHQEAQETLESRLRDIPNHFNTFTLDIDEMQAKLGTLLDLESVERIRRDLWQKANVFRHLSAYAMAGSTDPRVALRDTRQEFYNSIARQIEESELDEAERALNFLLDLDERDRFALLNKARIALERRDLPEAGLWIDLAREYGATAEELLVAELSVMVINGRMEEARERLNQALATRASDLQLWRLLSEVLISKGEFSELESRVLPAIHYATRPRDHYMIYVVRGFILKHGGIGGYYAARTAFLRALELNPHLLHIREEVLNIDDALNVLAFMEQDAKAMLRLDVEHAQANSLWGMVRYERGEFDLAEDLFLRSMKREPNGAACAGLGAIMLDRGRLDAAESLLRHAQKLDAHRPFTMHTLARMLIDGNRLEEADKQLQALLSSYPDDLEVQLTHIRLLIAQKRLRQAGMLTSRLLGQVDELPLPVSRKLRDLAVQLMREINR